MGALSLWTIGHLERWCADIGGRGTFAAGNPVPYSYKTVGNIDYGKHQGKPFLHVHFHDGDLSHARLAVPLNPRDYLYEKYRPLFKGVK